MMMLVQTSFDDDAYSFRFVLSCRYVDLDTLFREADIITLHVPLLPTTYHIINMWGGKLVNRSESQSFMQLLASIHLFVWASQHMAVCSLFVSSCVSVFENLINNVAGLQWSEWRRAWWSSTPPVVPWSGELGNGENSEKQKDDTTKRFYTDV